MSELNSPLEVIRGLLEIEGLEDQIRAIGDISPESQRKKIAVLRSQGKGFSRDQAVIYLGMILGEPDERGIIHMID